MLGITVVPTSAVKKTGVDDLLNSVIQVAENPDAHAPQELHYGEDIENAVQSAAEDLAETYGNVLEKYPKRWLVLKLIEGDEQVRSEAGIGANFSVDTALHHLKKAHGDDIEALMADTR
jgi:ferrous iron transport protein B